MSQDSTELSQRFRQQIDDHKIEVPMLPEVARKVMMLVNDEDSDAAQLSAVIQGDQTLAAHIIRIANSPIYTPAGNIVSLQQAISRLGMKLIAEVAMAASLSAKMFHAPQFEQRIKSLWNYSLMVGLWSKEVARIGRKNVEASFLCGLLHGIGKPVVFQWLSDQKVEITDDKAESLVADLFSAANATVMETWEMPQLVQDAVTSFEQGLDSLNEQALLIRAGKAMATWAMSDQSMTPSEVPDHGEALPKLNLYPDDIEKLIEKQDDVKQTLESMST